MSYYIYIITSINTKPTSSFHSITGRRLRNLIAISAALESVAQQGSLYEVASWIDSPAVVSY